MSKLDEIYAAIEQLRPQQPLIAERLTSLVNSCALRELTAFTCGALLMAQALSEDEDLLRPLQDLLECLR